MSKNITLREAANVLGISRDDVTMLIKMGKLIPIKKKHKMFLLYEQVQELKGKRKQWIFAIKVKNLPLRFLHFIITLFKKFPILSFLAIALPILALSLEYFVARPYIVTSEIRQNETDPLRAQFVIKNSGLVYANNLDIKVFDPYLMAKNGMCYLPYKNDKPGSILFSDQSLIAGIRVYPQQIYAFSLDRWVTSFFGAVIRNGGIKIALIGLQYSYTDCLEIFHYEDTAWYCLFPNGQELLWQPIGPKLLAEYISKFYAEINRHSSP